MPLTLGAILDKELTRHMIPKHKNDSRSAEEIAEKRIANFRRRHPNAQEKQVEYSVGKSIGKEVFF